MRPEQKPLPTLPWVSSLLIKDAHRLWTSGPQVNKVTVSLSGLLALLRQARAALLSHSFHVAQLTFSTSSATGPNMPVIQEQTWALETLFNDLILSACLTYSFHLLHQMHGPDVHSTVTAQGDSWTCAYKIIRMLVQGLLCCPHTCLPVVFVIINI